MGLEPGPQSREYSWGATGRISSGSGLEIREYYRGDPSRWPRDTLYPQTLALTQPTSGGCSVGIVRSRTKVTEFLWNCPAYWEPHDQWIYSTRCSFSLFNRCSATFPSRFSLWPFGFFPYGLRLLKGFILHHWNGKLYSVKHVSSLSALYCRLGTFERGTLIWVPSEDSAGCSSVTLNKSGLCSFEWNFPSSTSSTLIRTLTTGSPPAPLVKPRGSCWVVALRTPYSYSLDRNFETGLRDGLFRRILGFAPVLR
jgi:hypothetical protein